MTYPDGGPDPHHPLREGAVNWKQHFHTELHSQTNPPHTHTHTDLVLQELVYTAVVSDVSQQHLRCFDPHFIWRHSWNTHRTGRSNMWQNSSSSPPADEAQHPHLFSLELNLQINNLWMIRLRFCKRRDRPMRTQETNWHHQRCRVGGAYMIPLPFPVALSFSCSGWMLM